jgi:hypothetical protein
MNRLVLVSFFVLCFAESKRMKSSESLVPHAIKGIVDQYYAANERSIQVINFGKENGTGEKTIAKLKNFPIPIQISKDVRENKTEVIRLNSSCILIYD